MNNIIKISSILLLLTTILFGASSANYSQPQSTFNSGGALSSSANYSSDISLGQKTAVGTVSSTNYSGSIGFYRSRIVRPTLASVVIASDNATTTLAKVDDEITISFTSSDVLGATPVVTIAGQSVTVANPSGNNYTAKYTMQSGDSEGVIAFTIDFEDGANVAGSQVTNTTDASAVTFDETAPSGHSVVFSTDPVNNGNKSAVAFQFAGAEVGATYNYSIDDTNNATSAVTGTGTIGGATDTISGINVSSLDDDTLTIGVTLTDPTGNIDAGVQDTVVKDTLAPVVAEVTAVSTITPDSTPDYVFSNTQAGTLTMGGSCGTSTSTTISSTGSQTITLTQTNNSTALADGTYANCTIKITDANGNDSNVITIPSFSVDTTAPTAVTFNPADSGTHPKNSNITLTFNEAVRNTDDSEIINSNVASLLTLKLTNSSGVDVAFSATIDANKQVITIDPTSDLTESQDYYLAYTDVEDEAGNTRVGENITFTAQPDTTEPLVTTLSPTDNSTTLIDSNLTVVFNENIQVGTGDIVIKYDTNDSVVETFDVATSEKITITNSTLTINPTNNLVFNTKYYVDVANTAIKDTASTPNSFAGITSKGDWDFTTFAKLSLTNLEVPNIAYTESDSATAISSLIEIINPSGEDIIGASVTISSGFTSGEDVLAFSSQNGITGDFNTTTGVLTLSETTTIANYQTALRSVTYDNTNDSDPSTTSRVIDIAITDAKATSVVVQRTIDITAVDNTPDAFIFTALTNKSRNTLVESEVVVITGIENNIAISVVNGEYQLNQDGNWTTTNATIDNDDNVTLRQTSSASYSTATVVSLTVGDTTQDFNVTTSSAPYVAPPAPKVEEEVEEPKVEEETTVEEEPKTEEPKADDEPTVEEPKTQEPTVEEPTNDTELGKDTISISLPTEDGEERETVQTPKSEPKDLDTGTTISEYKEFEDTPPTDDGDTKTKTATYTTEDENGEKSEKSIVTEVEDTTITSTADGIEVKGTIIGENGTETTTTTKINDNGLIDIIVENNEDDTTSRISSYKVGGDVETKEDGETAVTFENTNSDDNQIELVAVASADGTVQHIVTITHEDGTVTTSKASSDIPNSKIIVTDDNKIQTIASVETQEGENVGIIAQTDDKGERLHIVSFIKADTGEQVTSVVKSSLEGSQTVMHEEEIETSVRKQQNGLELRAIATTKLNGETNTLFEILDIETGEVSTFDPTLDESTPFEANNKVFIENDTDGNMVIRTQTKITRKIIFK